MKDISYHITDIAQNSMNAGADRVEILIKRNSAEGKYTLKISDNGCGMSKEVLKRVTDPFYTSSVTKKVGLGLPLLKQNTELTGGTFTIDSVEGQGTVVSAVFNENHIDMIPEGDIALTFKILISAYPDRDICFRYVKDEEGFNLDTAEIKKELEGLSIRSKEVLEYITNFIRTEFNAVKR